MILDIETTGLDPYQHHIITIQTMRNDGIKIWKVWEQEEIVILQEFLSSLRTVSSDESILGYNNLKFDVPFIVGRLSIYGMMNSSIYRLLYDKKWVDLYQLLGDNYRSMKSWEERLGIKRVLNIRGRDIPMLYTRGEYHKIMNYVIEEIRVCQILYAKIVELLTSTKPYVQDMSSLKLLHTMNYT